MKIKHEMRLALRKAGIDLSRYNAAQSDAARVQMRLQAKQIDIILDVAAIQEQLFGGVHE